MVLCFNGGRLVLSFSPNKFFGLGLVGWWRWPVVRHYEGLFKSLLFYVGQCSKVGIPKSGHTVKKWAHHFFQLNTKNEYQQRLKELHHVGDLSLTISGSFHATF